MRSNAVFRIERIRIELNCRTPNWCLRIAWWYRKLPAHTHTLELGVNSFPCFSRKVLLFLFPTPPGNWLLSRVQLFATPWTIAHQAPLSTGYSRQEYWSGLPFPSPGDLCHLSIEPQSPSLQADSLLSEPPGKPICMYVYTHTHIHTHTHTHTFFFIYSFPLWLIT